MRGTSRLLSLARLLPAVSGPRLLSLVARQRLRQLHGMLELFDAVLPFVTPGQSMQICVEEGLKIWPELLGKHQSFMTADHRRTQELASR